jgi:hypothetical protein
MVDPAKRKILLHTIQSQPEWEKGQALVTAAEFFDGNDDLGSIGCNLTEHPGLEHFQKVLKELEARNDVDEIWLQIYDVDEGEWPFSENILIFGTVTKPTIQQHSTSLQPSEVHETDLDWVPCRAKHLFGKRYVNLWWD